ncbi:hypothetical protein [Streptomyces carpinensis]|uniref:Uncharacterized protein n=1 Tax=Streptomyces carpinensis TaxID=66369 RepID=A0ABV1W562_9ACTN|nr:hypothetical protein [Streptomyces carpinensis]
MGVIAPAAMAGGNYDYGTSRTSLSNGTLWTSLTSGTGASWNVIDSYDKKPNTSTITALFGWTHVGTAHTGSWFTQSAGTTKSTKWSNYTLSGCNSVIGWMEVQGQQTFNNAPVTQC